MKLRTLAVRALMVVVGLPLLVVVLAIGTISTLDRTNGSIVSGGRKREYLLYVPPGYDPAKPAPLVISLHGAAVWPAQQKNTSRWDDLAAANGFIVVYPAGTREGPRIWHVERGAALDRDVRFIADLIDTLKAAYRIDPARIYVNGFSNGGGMAFVLSCTMSDRIAAVGTVSAAQTLPFSWCKDSLPVPVIAFHGTADPIVPYLGGKSPAAPAPFPAVQDFIASWAGRNGCADRPIDAAVSDDLSRRTYGGCTDGASVLLYTVRGAGHQWPGGKPMPAWLLGRASNSIDATAEMWAFFQAHPRPAAGVARR